ncbi:hypothetical protein OHC33_005721 [Knufia fluminis]|uniref:Zn(2)-C6 fungal-type domain-containing protein n=1 Tax=Knufia fluminis TaxID=191047 RepID=A0AAN8EJY7_9EURO|nr:hypothetical protein OHC33_005721 [Knufia fluminis]
MPPTDGTPSDTDVRASTGKKRIPKACNPCRHSKVKCDEQRPSCTRCQTLKKTCIYVEKPKTAEEQKIEDLEQEVLVLRQQLQTQRDTESSIVVSQPQRLMGQRPPEITSPDSNASLDHSSPTWTSDKPLKRKRSHFRMQKEVAVPDFINEGILSEPQALHYFNSFFEGCDRYVPIFDGSDGFAAVRLRSSLLLNAICAVGCGISGDASVDSRILHVRLKRWLTTVILSTHAQSLETVQALLVMACWMPERSLILAIATRMAVELQLDDAFDRLVNLSISRPDTPETHILMKSARTWFLLLNLEQILQVDAGNLVDLRIKGVRRCRTLLNRPFSSRLDARLFSQVELNRLRAKVNETLTSHSDDLLQAVQEARVDIDVWYQDWKRIMEASPLSESELPSLIANLTVQRHWAEAMAACRAVRATGVHQVEMMSPEAHDMLVIAKEALQNHLYVMLSQPHYLANFRYAMDFVWAKCAFSFLLLLKLTILLPDVARQDLLGQGRALLNEPTKSSGYGSSKVYLRLLQLTIEKYASRDQTHSGELDAFIPEEFIFEWDFPGLNLFSSPTGWDMLFDQYMIGDDLFVGMDI